MPRPAILALAEGVGDHDFLTREGTAELRSIGTLFSLPGFFAALASACAGRGNVGEGLPASRKGLAMKRTGGERFQMHPWGRPL